MAITSHDSNFKSVSTGRKVGKGHLVVVRRCHHPFIGETFEPVIETFAGGYHNGTGSQLNRKGVVAGTKFYLTIQIKRLVQNHMIIIFFTDSQQMVEKNKVAENHFRLRLNGFLTAFREYIHTFLSANHDIALLQRTDRTVIKLPFLQAVETIVTHDGKLIAIVMPGNGNLTDSFVGGYPDVSMMVLSNGTGYRSDKTIIGIQFIKIIITFVEDIQS